MEEISVKDIITIIWKGKWLIAIISVVCLVLGLTYSFVIMKPSYEADTVLQITPVKATNSGSVETIPDIVAYLAKEPSNSIEMYAAQIKMDSVLAVAAESINYNMSNGNYLSLFRSQVTVSSTENTNMISIRFKASSGDTAVIGANAVADAYVNYVSEVINTHVKNSYDFILMLYESESVILQESKVMLEDFMSGQRGITEVQNELNSHMSLINTYKNKLIDLEITINYNKAGLATATRLLLDTPSLVDVINDSVNEQVPNPSYTALVNKINNYEITISVDQAKLKLYEKSLKDLQSGIVDLRSELDLLKTESDVLNMNYSRSKDAVDLYQSELEALEVKLTANIGSKSVVKIADAIGYNEVGTSKTIIILLVSIVGLMLGVFIVFIKNSFREDERKTSREN